MRAHPRVRKTVKWGGAALCVALLGLWVMSGWYAISLYTADTHAPILLQGTLSVLVWEESSAGFHGPRMTRMFDSIDIASVPSHFRWWFGGRGEGETRFYDLPLWIPFVGVGIATTCAWRLDQAARSRANRAACPRCCYSRAGLSGAAACPECGAKPP